MSHSETEDINEQKIHRLAQLLEQVLIDIGLSVLYQLHHHQNDSRHACYKSGCSLREHIPF